jgi:hypothetical protein
MFDHPLSASRTFQRKAAWAFHALIMLFGAFICVGGTYATIKAIVDAYANGTVGMFSPFSLSFFPFSSFYGPRLAPSPLFVGNQGPWNVLFWGNGA